MPFSATAAEVAKTLGGAKKAGRSWLARCPCHEDKTASLKLTDKKEGGLLWHCFAGCTQDALLAELQRQGILEAAKERTRAATGSAGAPKPPPPPLKAIEGGKLDEDEGGEAEGEGSREANFRGTSAVYEYTDEQHQALFRVLRYPDKRKGFPCARLVQGKWLWGMSSRTKRVLYHLPELANATTVFVCEGEKDVDNLRALGLVATCNPGGADSSTGDKWREEYGWHLKGKNVVILPDLDQPGRDHARKVFDNCKKHRALSICILDAEADLGLKEKGQDVSDWLAQGHTVDELRGLWKAADKWELGDASERPKMRIKGGTLDDNALEAERIIGKETRRHQFTGLYRTGTDLVRPVRLTEKDRTASHPVGSLILSPANANYLRRYLTRLIDFEKFDERTEVWNEADCTEALAKAVTEGMPWEPVPALIGTVETPTLRPDGTLLDRPGYDEPSGLLFDPCGVKFPQIDPRPGMIEAQRALSLLAKPFREFPFDDGPEGASKAVFLSALLTSVVRRSLRTAPMFGFDAPAPGTGKTLLADSVSYLATGRPPATMSPIEDPVEERKRFLTVLLDGTAVLLIDNVEHVMKSATLCTILTQPEWSDRLLGSNRKAIVRTNMLVMTSGNNLGIAKDLVRRTLIASLDARDERPEERRFAGRPLLDTILDQRPQLVAAALTIILAYLHAGSPRPDVVSYGNFETWQEWCRFPLIWLGCADPYATKAKLEDRDNSRAELEELLSAWYGIFGEEAYTVGNALRHVKEITEGSGGARGEKYNAWSDCMDRFRIKGRDVNTRSLGNYLSANVGVLRKGMHFQRGKIEHQAVQWKVVKV